MQALKMFCVITEFPRIYSVALGDSVVDEILSVSVIPSPAPRIPAEFVSPVQSV